MGEIIGIAVGCALFGFLMATGLFIFQKYRAQATMATRSTRALSTSTQVTEVQMEDIQNVTMTPV